MFTDNPGCHNQELKWEDAKSDHGNGYKIGTATKVAGDFTACSQLAAASMTATQVEKKPFGSLIDWPVAMSWKETTPEVRKITGIKRYINYRRRGILFEYRLEFETEVDYNYYFVDKTGDRYNNNVFRLGYHGIDYNSADPTMILITGA